jgi:CheY-like chemotaxis protein
MAMKRDLEKCLEAGGTDYKSKLIQPDDLVKMIEKYFNQP